MSRKPILAKLQYGTAADTVAIGASVGAAP